MQFDYEMANPLLYLKKRIEDIEERVVDVSPSKSHAGNDSIFKRYTDRIENGVFIPEGDINTNVEPEQVSD